MRVAAGDGAHASSNSKRACSRNRSNPLEEIDMNTGLKNKLLVLAAAAGLAAFGTACSSSEEAPAAEEGAPAEATSGAEEAAPAEGEAAPAEGEAAPAEAAGGEGSCGEGSCS
jgi:hypothetical protein